MNDWKIQSRARSCHACHRAFEDQEVYHTLLFEVRASFERQDVCHACWDQQHRHGAADRKGFVSHWKGQFAVPPPAPPDPIQRDSAESLLRRLVEANQPALQPAAFILAVMLERKRILKIREQLRRDGSRIFVYELPKTGEIFTIPDPDLHLHQLEAVQRDVAHLLEHGLPGDPASPGLPDSPQPQSQSDPDPASVPPADSPTFDSQSPESPHLPSQPPHPIAPPHDSTAPSPCEVATPTAC